MQRLDACRAPIARVAHPRSCCALANNPAQLVLKPLETLTCMPALGVVQGASCEGAVPAWHEGLRAGSGLQQNPEPLNPAWPCRRLYGAPRCMACFHGVVALGCSSGVAFVLLPRGLGAEGPDGRPKASAPALPKRCSCMLHPASASALVCYRMAARHVLAAGSLHAPMRGPGKKHLTCPQEPCWVCFRPPREPERLDGKAGCRPRSLARRSCAWASRGQGMTRR